MKRRDDSSPGSASVDAAGAGGEFSEFALEEASDDKVLKSAFWLAVAVHLVLLVVNFPSLGPETVAEEENEKTVFVVQQHRFKPPPPPPPERIPQKRVERIPMPDPTPDDPEPLPREDPEPEIELPDVEVDVFAFPEAPPALDVPDGPIQVIGEVVKPEKIYAPQPAYTELARKARIEGLVIMQAIIDREGNVAYTTKSGGIPEARDHSEVLAHIG